MFSRRFSNVFLRSIDFKKLTLAANEHLSRGMCSSGPDNKFLKSASWTSTQYTHQDVQSKGDPDTFGSLADQHGDVFEMPATGDVEELFDSINSATADDERDRRKPYWYMAQCRMLAGKGKIDECVEMLTERMLKVDQVFPKDYNFGVVIGALGQVGQAQKAFELYYKLLDYGLKPQMGVYTGLFNAVANSRNPKHLSGARKVYEKLRTNKHLMNNKVFNSYLKAVCKHSQSVAEPFVVFQDLIRAGKVPCNQTFIALMSACGKNKKTGFLHAIQVWRQMVALGIKPSAETVTVLLRICAQCGIGKDPTLLNRTLLDGSSSSKRLSESRRVVESMRNVYWLKGQTSRPKQLPDDQHQHQQQQLGEAEVVELVEVKEAEAETGVVVEAKRARSLGEAIDAEMKRAQASIALLPSLASADDDDDDSAVSTMSREQVARVESVGACRSKWERLQLIGGHRALLRLIEDERLKPNVQTFVWLAQCCEPDADSEREIIDFYMSTRAPGEYDVKLFNQMIERRSYRRDYEAAQEICDMIERLGLKSDVYTLRLKASMAHTRPLILQFIEQLPNQSVKPDASVFNSLIARVQRLPKRLIRGYTNAYAPHYDLMVKVLEAMKGCEGGVAADVRTIELLEFTNRYPPNYQRWRVHEARLERELRHFRSFYHAWLRRNKMEKRSRELCDDDDDKLDDVTSAT